MIRLTSKTNPCGLKLGEMVTVKRICSVIYDYDNNRKLVFEKFQKSGVVIGCVKKALGKYVKGNQNIYSLDGEYEPPRLDVSEYVRLYQISIVTGKHNQ